MAKWGEGDPRWIVEERPDATNVNNWHWTEKNADQWSKNKITELFTKFVIDHPSIGKVTISEVDKCEGEARVNNRKAKLIFFYEWELVLKWEGVVNGKDTQIEGKITIPNLSEEHSDMKDVDVDVSVTKNLNDGEPLKEMLRKGLGAEKIREKLQAYVDALKTEYSQKGLILPGKDGATPQKEVVKGGKTIVNTSSSSMNNGMKKLDISTASSGVKIHVSKIEMSEAFKCTGQEIFNALTQKEMLQLFTGADVKMNEAKSGEEFEMLGGNIQGRFVEVAPFSKIVQKWRLKSWPAGHYSDVVITIKQGSEDTKLELSQTNVPEKELENTKIGWSRYYWEAIRRSFGFGSVLY